MVLHIPCGKRLHNYGKLQFLMDKSTISMAMFNSFLYVYQRVTYLSPLQLSTSRSAVGRLRPPRKAAAPLQRRDTRGGVNPGNNFVTLW